MEGPTPASALGPNLEVLLLYSYNHLILSDCLDFTWLGLLYTLNRLASTPSPMKVEFAFAAASFSGSAGANSNT